MEGVLGIVETSGVEDVTISRTGLRGIKYGSSGSIRSVMLFVVPVFYR